MKPIELVRTLGKIPDKCPHCYIFKGDYLCLHPKSRIYNNKIPFSVSLLWEGCDEPCSSEDWKECPYTVNKLEEEPYA